MKVTYFWPDGSAYCSIFKVGGGIVGGTSAAKDWLFSATVGEIFFTGVDPVLAR
jgi:hypothetical protein